VKAPIFRKLGSGVQQHWLHSQTLLQQRCVRVSELARDSLASVGLTRSSRDPILESMLEQMHQQMQASHQDALDQLPGPTDTRAKEP
jgi:hypothetical protein